MSDAREKAARAMYESDAMVAYLESIRPDESLDDDVVIDGTLNFAKLADAAIAAHLEALKADGYAVVKLPEPSEWIDGQPQWNDYPFVRLTPGADDEIALGARGEYLYGINRHEARNVAAALFAAADAAEAQR